MTATLNFATLFNTTAATTTHRGRARDEAPRNALRDIITTMATDVRVPAGAAADVKVTLSRTGIIEKMMERGYSKTQASHMLRELVSSDAAWLISNHVAILQDSARGAAGRSDSRTLRNLAEVTELMKQIATQFPDGIPRPELHRRAAAAGIAASAIKQHEEAAAAATGVTILDGRRGGRQADPVKAMIAQAFIDQIVATGNSLEQINCAQGGAQLSKAWDVYHAQNAVPGVVADEWSPTSAAAYLRAHLRNMLSQGGAEDVAEEVAEEVAEDVGEDVGEDVAGSGNAEEENMYS